MDGMTVTGETELLREKKKKPVLMSLVPPKFYTGWFRIEAGTQL